jgi:hypothetical protein
MRGLGLCTSENHIFSIARRHILQLQHLSTAFPVTILFSEASSASLGFHLHDDHVSCARKETSAVELTLITLCK